MSSSYPSFYTFYLLYVFILLSYKSFCSLQHFVFSILCLFLLYFYSQSHRAFLPALTTVLCNRQLLSVCLTFVLHLSAIHCPQVLLWTYLPLFLYFASLLSYFFSPFSPVLCQLVIDLQFRYLLTYMLITISLAVSFLYFSA